MATLVRMTPVLLAFDTSTEALAVALQGPQGDRQVLNTAGGALASSHLLPAIQTMLDGAGVVLGQVTAIAFGCGPGAFTGLRTACAVAQGLAFGADKPVLPLDSLLIVAEDERVRLGEPAALEVSVAMDARMGELYAARYVWAHGRWQTIEPPGLWAPQDWWRQNCAAEAGPCVPRAWAGSGVALVAAAVESEDPAKVQHLRLIPADCTNRAAALLRRADQAWREGAALPAEQALPVYLRDKVALTTAERQALKGGA